MSQGLQIDCNDSEITSTITETVKPKIPKTEEKKKATVWAGPDGWEEYKTLPCPVDEEGYIISFNLNETEKFEEFFNTYGVVVVRNVLDTKECDKTIEEIWGHIHDYYSSDIQQDDPSSWNRYWPSLSHLGMLGNLRILSPQACDNRQNPNVYKVFSTLFHSEELMVDVTRASMMRPTKGLKWKGQDELVDMPKWKTVSEWLHLDLNPYSERCSSYGFTVAPPLSGEEEQKQVLESNKSNICNAFDTLKVQGILALKDCGPNDGGFQCVPGFHRSIRTWCKANEEHCKKASGGYDSTTVQIPKEDSIWKDIQHMPIRKGSLLIWSSRLPHGTFPNDSNQFRIIQYIRMAHASDRALSPYSFGPENMNKLPQDFKLTALGRKLYGFDLWPSSWYQTIDLKHSIRDPKVEAEEKKLRAILEANEREFISGKNSPKKEDTKQKGKKIKKLNFRSVGVLISVICLLISIVVGYYRIYR